MSIRIALIHAVTVAVAPVETAFRELWPEADCANILDDSLSGDRERDGRLTAAMTGRIIALAEYGRATGAAAILFTCSAFGEAIEAAAAGLPIPVLKPNEAMFEAALNAGRRIGMLATFAPSVASMEDEFRHMAAACGSPRRSTPIACRVRWRRSRRGTPQPMTGWSPTQHRALPITTRCCSRTSRRRAPRRPRAPRWGVRF